MVGSVYNQISAPPIYMMKSEEFANKYAFRTDYKTFNKSTDDNLKWLKKNVAIGILEGHGETMTTIAKIDALFPVNKYEIKMLESFEGPYQKFGFICKRIVGIYQHLGLPMSDDICWMAEMLFEHLENVTNWVPGLLDKYTIGATKKEEEFDIAHVLGAIESAMINYSKMINYIGSAILEEEDHRITGRSDV